MRPGRREGVEGEIHRDLTTLARNKAVSDVMVVSAEEDLAQVIADVQDMGMRVTLLHIATDGDWTISRTLRQECDDIVEISAAQLRPYVELISGAEPPRPDESDGRTLRPAMNGSVNGNGVNGNGTATAPGRAVAYARPQGRPGTGPQPPVQPGPPVSPAPAAAEQPGRQAPQPVAMDAAQGDPGQPERGDVPDFGANVDYSASVDYGAAADYAPGADHAPAADQAAAVDYGSALDYGPMVDYGPRLRGACAHVPAGPPVPGVRPTVSDRDRDRDRSARPRLGGDLAAYNPGAIRDQYQRDGMLREAPAVDNGDRLQPVPVALPGSGSAQVRRLPTRGPVPGGPNPGQQALGLPPAPADGGIGQQPGRRAARRSADGRPAGRARRPGGAHGLSGCSRRFPRRTAPCDPGAGRARRAGTAGAPGSPASAAGSAGPAGSPGSVHSAAARGDRRFPGPSRRSGGPSGAIGLAGPGGYSGGAPGVSLADAVQSAHEEGQAFGESVARDAPALWLEAVLARKPRMPSDLEARLLQGSALPIDFLLHDEVRHALRRGFWDALERARR